MRPIPAISFLTSLSGGVHCVGEAQGEYDMAFSFLPPLLLECSICCISIYYKEYSLSRTIFHIMETSKQDLETVEKDLKGTRRESCAAAGERALGHLAAAIREFRRQNRLSLDQLSERSGVSRSMICQIEREKAVPTIQVIVKLAHAMDRPVGALVDPCGADAGLRVASLASQPRVVSEDGSCTARSVTGGSPNRSVEIWEIAFDRAGRYPLPKLPFGATAFFTLWRGALVLETPGRRARLGEGEVAELGLSGEHALVQEGEGASRGQLVIHSRCS